MSSLCYTIFFLSFFLQARVYLVSISASIPFTCTIEPPSIPCILSNLSFLYYFSCISPFSLIALLTTFHIFHPITLNSQPGFSVSRSYHPPCSLTHILVFHSSFFLHVFPSPGSRLPSILSRSVLIRSSHH